MATLLVECSPADRAHRGSGNLDRRDRGRSGGTAGPSFIALFNIAFAVVLMLPVSHYFYVIYAVPTLWWWGARLLERPRSAIGWTAFAVLLVWWIVVFRLRPQAMDS